MFFSSLFSISSRDAFPTLSHLCSLRVWLIPETLVRGERGSAWREGGEARPSPTRFSGTREPFSERAVPLASLHSPTCQILAPDHSGSCSAYLCSLSTHPFWQWLRTNLPKKFLNHFTRVERPLRATQFVLSNTSFKKNIRDLLPPENIWRQERESG